MLNNREIKRKLVHFLAAFYILGYVLLPRKIILLIVGSILGIIILIELLRFISPSLNKFLFSTIGKFMSYRSVEYINPSGLIYTFSGAFFTMLLFKRKEIIVLSLCYQVFGDSMAALVGTAVGRIKIMKSKTVEGSIACFLTCLLCAYIVIPPYEHKAIVMLISAIVATLIELFPFPKPSDNFWLPFISAVLLKYLFSVYRIF
jgi:dolichol kinase